MLGIYPQAGSECVPELTLKKKDEKASPVYAGEDPAIDPNDNQYLLLPRDNKDEESGDEE